MKILTIEIREIFHFSRFILLQKKFHNPYWLLIYSFFSRVGNTESNCILIFCLDSSNLFFTVIEVHAKSIYYYVQMNERWMKIHQFQSYDIKHINNGNKYCLFYRNCMQADSYYGYLSIVLTLSQYNEQFYNYYEFEITDVYTLNIYAVYYDFTLLFLHQHRSRFSRLW